MTEVKPLRGVKVTECATVQRELEAWKSITSMRLILEIVSGSQAGKKIVLEAGRVARVGRTGKADFATQDSYMSGEHFAVENDGQTVRIRDLNSRNGTLLNEERVVEATLHDNDRVFAGQTNFVVKIEGAAPANVRPPAVELLETIRPGTSRPLPPEPETPTSGLSAALPDHPAPPDVATALTRDQVSSGERAEPSEPPALEHRPAEHHKEDHFSEDPSATPAPDSSMRQALGSYAAATPEGRLLNILRTQPEPLFALVDAANEPQVIDLLRISREEYQSLYKEEAAASVTPYLVRLPAQSPLLERMVHDGWGHDWGVYLTCRWPLKAIRDYFRQSLMFKTEDGQEFFSRFYIPSFFRDFLIGCTPAETKLFFGPISSYLMEDKNSAVLLHFTRTSKGAELKKRLLLLPEP